MRTWWVLIRNDGGAGIRVTVQGDNAYNAFQIAKRLYGSSLISQHANLC